MTLTIETQTLPLTLSYDGVVRVGGTRVTLDTVVEAFLEGATAEEIAQQYPSLFLSDIYSVIGYYLRKSEDVNKYIQQQKVKTVRVRQQNEARFDPDGVRDRLLARKAGSGV